MLTVVSQNVQYRAAAEGRWAGLAAAIRSVTPHLVLLQECDWLADETHAQRAALDLGLCLTVAPSRNLPTAVAWDPHRLRLVGCDTHFATQLHHGYCAPRFDSLDQPLPVPLIAISTHLTPFSAAQAAMEASMVGSRAYLHGGLGFIAGDINHCPLGDPEPPWEKVQPYNRMSRCRRRTHDDDPWVGDTIVGQTLRDGGFIDVAAHLAHHASDPTLRQPTGQGRVRIDQAHVTSALVPAISDYRRLDTRQYSDHHGIAFTLDLTRIDASCLRQYT